MIAYPSRASLASFACAQDDNHLYPSREIMAFVFCNLKIFMGSAFIFSSSFVASHRQGSSFLLLA